jgi:hypothetical protein
VRARSETAVTVAPGRRGRDDRRAGVAPRHHLPYVELDALHHGPHWTARPSFAEEVRRLAGGDRWITEWQYADARPVLAERADLLVFLDLSRRVVMTRIVRRTLGRRLRHTELWNANVEPPLRAILSDRDHIVRWAWRTHTEHGGRVSELAQRRPDLPVVRLRTPAEAEQWLAGPVARASSR